MINRQPTVSWLLMVLVLAIPHWQARAEEETRFYITVHFSGNFWPDGFAEEVVTDLSVELGRQGIDVRLKTQGFDEAPITAVEVVAKDGPDVVIMLNIRDDVTSKHVSRKLNLTGIPLDAQSYAVAVAIDELLKASWAEVILRKSPRPADPPPAVVQKAVTASIHPDALRSRKEKHEIGGRFAATYYTGGITQLGGNLFYGIRFFDRLTIELSAGGAGALPITATHGKIHGYAIGGELSLVGGLLPMSKRFQFDMALGVQGMAVTFIGRAKAGEFDDRVTLPVIITHLTLRPSWHLTDKLILRAGIGAGPVIYGVSATDGNEIAAGITGIAIIAHVSVAVNI